MKPLLLLLLCGSSAAQSWPDLAPLLEYDRSTDPGVEQSIKERSDFITVSDFSFNSPVSGRIPGLLVTPLESGPHPLILFGHWIMPGSPLRNKGEFLEEATLLAEAGALCLLLDGPPVRPYATTDPEPMNGQGPNAQLQMAKEWRFALDILLERNDVDPGRIAYVGHSFNAGVGALLAGTEKRIGAFVLMASVHSFREYVYDDRIPAMVKDRRNRGDEWIEQYLGKFPWADRVEFAKRSSPAAVFLQFGRNDKPIPLHVAERDFAHFGEPKRMGIYDAGHELNSQARIERVDWLTERLGLQSIAHERLRAIPHLH